MPENLQTFQLAFGKYLRNPEQVQIPEGINSQRAKIYEDLLFNNVSGFINSCFPVCKSLVDENQWYTLRRSFFRDWRSHSPYFREIPQEFLEYLNEASTPLPPWFYELAHYEWIELFVDTFDDEIDSPEFENLEIQPQEIEFDKPTLTDKNSRLVLCANTTLQNLEYEWPVHTISSTHIPNTPSPTFLAVFRNNKFEVKFQELNAATSLLLRIVQEGPCSRDEAVQNFVQITDQQASDDLQGFADSLFNTFIKNELLIEIGEG